MGGRRVPTEARAGQEKPSGEEAFAWRGLLLEGLGLGHSYGQAAEPLL